MTDTTAPVHAAAPDGSSECDTAGTTTESFEEITCPACLALLQPWVDGTAEIRVEADGSMHLTPEQAAMVVDTLAWNVDVDTVRCDNEDPERATFIKAMIKLRRRG
jgi:hypothetical protein